MNRPDHDTLLQKVCRFYFALLAAVLVFSLSGCSANPTIEMNEKLGGPGVDETLAGASQTQCQGDPARLVIEMRRVVKAFEWGLERLDITPSPVQLPALPTHEKAGSHGSIIHATARSAADVSIIIVAWPVSENRVAMAVKAGYFGDPSLQEKFLRAWAERLQGNAVAGRDATFTLPQ